MPFDLNKLLGRSKVKVVKNNPKPKVEEPEPLQIYIPAYEPESDDEIAIPKVKTSLTQRKVPLNPLSNE